MNKMKNPLHPNTLNLIWFCVVFILVMASMAILDHLGWIRVY